MSITRKDVERVANLARLAVTEEEVALYTDQLQRILSHVDKLSEVDTEGVEVLGCTDENASAMREDTPAKSLNREEALLNAPSKESGHFRVPQIIE